jgi:hypothetical protein
MIFSDLAPYEATCAHPGSELSRVATAVAAAGWRGVVLPPTKVSEQLVYPVIVMLPAAAERLLAGDGPELQRSTLAIWESWPSAGGVQPPSPPVEIIGFVSVAPWRPALVSLGRLAGYGAGMVLRQASPTALNLLEADFTGTWVSSVSAAGAAKILVLGRPGAVETARRTVGQRHHEELLFEHALTAGWGDL